MSTDSSRSGTPSAGNDARDSEGPSIVEEIERVEATGHVVASGFGMVSGHLSKERQARLDRQLDSLESIGRGLDREEKHVRRQFHELAGEVETAGQVFFEAIFDTENFKKKHGLSD